LTVLKIPSNYCVADRFIALKTWSSNYASGLELQQCYPEAPLGRLHTEISSIKHCKLDVTQQISWTL